MILVDTSVWIDYFHGKVNLHTDALDAALVAGTVAIADLKLSRPTQERHHNSQNKSPA